jgi:colicin D
VAVTQEVDPLVVKQAGDAWREVHDEAAAAVTRLAGVLEGSAGMAGSDNGAHAWASKYDPLSRDAVGAASAVVSAAGKISDLLHATAVNHANGDQQSAINDPHPPAVPPASVPVFPVPSVPSAEGGFGDVPGWWHPIQAYGQGELWPNGHQDQLHAAAQAWRNTAAGLQAAIFAANGAMPYLANQKSPEIPAATANCNKVRDAMNSAAEGCDVAAKSCDDYASGIDAAHHRIVHEMEVLGGTVAVTEVVAAVLIPFTAGASEAVSKVVDVSRLTAVGARIATIIREFRAAAELSALPTVSAAGAAARSTSELGPLLAARPTIYAAETAGRGGAIERAEALTGGRPLITTRAQIEKKFDKHAADFGITESRGNGGFQQFEQAVKSHVDNPSTLHINGTCRGDAAIINYNPNTGLAVIQKPNGEFVSGWRLSSQQATNVLLKGGLR